MSGHDRATHDQSMGTHAIVLGGSMAGLLAARVLADHFDRVTLVERDCLPEYPAHRKGVPQGRHAHGLLARGREILSRLFPDLVPELEARGAVMVHMGADLRWHHYGGCKIQFPSGLVGPFMSRPLLEWSIRRRVLGLLKLECIQNCVATDLNASDDHTRVTGVTLRRHNGAEHEAHLTADLVVDATRRGSRSPRWLETLGYSRPAESSITIGVDYTTRIFRRTPMSIRGAKAVFASPTPPRERRGGALLPLEGDRWLVTLVGSLGDHAPADEHGFLRFARTLPAPDISTVVARSEALTDCFAYTFPANLRRRYERMSRLPDGYIVLGDALCSCNPVYGQGMTVSALEAQVLDAYLREQLRMGRGWHGFPQRFFGQAAQVIDVPWSLAASADFSYPGVKGHKAPGTDLINWYVARAQRAALQDPDVHLAFLRVINLIGPLPRLFAPRIMLRVLGARHASRVGMQASMHMSE